MIDPGQFRRLIIRPTLIELGLYSEAAEALLLGTAIVESGLVYIQQRGHGPALGVFQIEPTTHRDVHQNYLAFRGELDRKIKRLMNAQAAELNLISNLAYATAIARLVYYRRPEALPASGDLPGLAAYWKEHYNTHLGAGTEDDFIARAGPHIAAT